MAKKSRTDAYLTWVTQGKLASKLNEVQILAKTGSEEKVIAEWLKISIKEYEELKRKYPDFKRATNPNECGEMIRLVTSLQRQAEGYHETTVRKNAYVNKKDENRFQKEETEHYYPGNPIIGIYLLEVFYGSRWNKDYAKLMAKADKEEWSDGNSDGRNR